MITGDTEKGRSDQLDERALLNGAVTSRSSRAPFHAEHYLSGPPKIARLQHVRRMAEPAVSGSMTGPST